MRNNAQLKLHNVYATDDFMVAKNLRPLLWKPSKKKTTRKQNIIGNMLGLIQGARPCSERTQARALRIVLNTSSMKA
jgi:hypothetical protein